MKTYALMAAFSLSFLLFNPQLINATSTSNDIQQLQKQSTFGNVIQVFTGYAQTSTTELTVHYSGSYNFSNELLLPTQVVRFKNAQGQVISMVLAVRSYATTNGSLQVTYTIGGNNLSGLALESTQSIIVQDDIVI